MLGIFEGSVGVGCALLREGEGEGEEGGDEAGKGGEKFGIISTGDIWKEVLSQAVRGEVLGAEKVGRVFAGVETCGLDAGELHGDGEVEGRVKDAAKRLVGVEGVGVVVLGCAGMVGMEGWVREVVGGEVRVVDGVKAGVGVLQGLCRGGF